ncbi:MAG: RluA family pseudouridine synthase [Bacteroidales bacterium]|nr:RluA family pseudouridine synthase [Bacteroidales bacterium]
MEILYEDNHLIAVNKTCHDLVQKDKTGDDSLIEKIKQYLKKKYKKPGNVFLGVPHRLDRPVSGVVIFAKTSKALTRMSNKFRDGEIQKTYWAIVKQLPVKTEETLSHFIVRDTKKNKSFCFDTEVKNSKLAQLHYRVIANSERYHLLEIDLMTGRHHQIRAQLSCIGSPVKGDLKYGYPRSNPDGGISLHACKIQFEHPVTKENITIEAPLPESDTFWKYFDL